MYPVLNTMHPIRPCISLPRPSCQVKEHMRCKVIKQLADKTYRLTFMVGVSRPFSTVNGSRVT